MKNIKDIFKTNIKLLMLAIICLVLFSILIIRLVTDDGTSKKGIVNVYYKTSSSNKILNSWKKNGKTSGNKKSDINKIEIKTKGNDYVDFNIYSSGTWVHKVDNKKLEGIQAIKVALIDDYYKKYYICYRTYNEKNKWLEWTCNGEISGNSSQNIKAVQVKIIPKNVIKKEYLKDYEKTSNYSSIGF